MRTGVPTTVSSTCSSLVNPNSSAAATAPRGLHRPKITAASAMKPLPEDMFALNAPDRTDAEERPAEPGDQPGEHHVAVADAPDVDADGVGGPRVLADRAGAQPPAGAEQPDVDDDDEDVHQVDDDVGVEQQRAEDRDVGQPRDADRREDPGGVVGLGVLLHQRVVQVAGQPQHQQVEHDAEDDLVDQVADREDREQRADQRAGEGGGDDAQPEAGGHRGEQRAGERPGQQLPLDGDVDDAGALADDAGQRAEDQRRRGEDRQLQRAEQVDRRARLPGRRPAQEGEGRTAGSPRPATHRSAGRENPRASCQTPSATITAPSTMATVPPGMRITGICTVSRRRGQRERGVAGVGADAPGEDRDEPGDHDEDAGHDPAAGGAGVGDRGATAPGVRVPWAAAR